MRCLPLLFAADPASAGTIELLKAKLVAWRRSLADADGTIGVDPVRWKDELGEPARIDAYFRSYLQQDKRLGQIDPSRPGRTGLVQDWLSQER